MQHTEFFHIPHFEQYYHRVKPPPELAQFIDFFWQTNFDALWKHHPSGFSDVLFPNIGYTYLINLGNSYTMQVGERKFEMKTHGFLPRNQSIECYHQPGNCLFGIKFRISPVVYNTKVNFSEYREYVFPLSYLLEQKVLNRVKTATSFDKRVKLLCQYFQSVIQTVQEVPLPVRVVSSVLKFCERENNFSKPVEDFAAEHHISSRTLQRYFETCTSINCKKAMQILRIRRAAEHLALSPDDFHYTQYGYYDYSHFCKHLKQFLNKPAMDIAKPHLALLARAKAMSKNGEDGMEVLV